MNIIVSYVSYFILYDSLFFLSTQLVYSNQLLNQSLDRNCGKVLYGILGTRQQSLVPLTIIASLTTYEGTIYN